MLELRRTTMIVALGWIAAVLPGSQPLAAQGTRATLRGTLRSAAGAPQPSVTINVVNLETEAERQAITEADGTWVVGGLLPGRYQIRVDETGFVPYRGDAIVLTAGQQSTTDIILRPTTPPAIAPRPPTGQPTPAQAARATLRGTLRSAAGAPQPSVTINVVNLGSEAERQAITEADGTWVVGGLLPGRYQIRVDETGFVPYRSDAIVLTAGQQRTADITLRATPATAGPPPAPSPAAPAQAAPPTPAAPAVLVPDYIPSPDRWRLEFPVWYRYPPELQGDYPYVTARRLDPYNQNVLKGDYPAFGNDVFVVLTGVLETPFEYRRVPTPGGVSTGRADTDPFFGKPEQFSFVSEAVASFEMFKGDTSFKPRQWAFRVTPVFNLNYVNVGEYNVVNVSPEGGKIRRRTDLALQEAFGEVKLFDIGSNYDFVSVRAGIQPFTSDFRGFLYRDTNLGVRLFGTWGRNRNQWNLAAFDQLEKETNSELNLTGRRGQKVLIANYFRQDFLTPGYTISPSFHANLDDGAEKFFDENGFLVRPSPIGLIQGHRVHAYYAGLAGDGHWGPINVSHQFYQAFGTDEFNGIAGQAVDINARFASAEVSFDHDWWRIKGTFIWASGDSNPDDDKAEGFDAIFDNPNIAGGPFSFWNREGIRLTQTSVGLVARSSILPSLRSSKVEGQANFVNPGLFEYNAGFEADVTPKLRMTADANLLRFQYTDVLSRVLFQSNIDRSIGTDYSVGFQYRPALNDNVIVTGGASLFMPSAGFKNLLTTDKLFAPFVVLSLRY